MDIDECSSKPCIHGVCQDGLAEYSCTCDAGYTGTNCELDNDECSSNPCIHGTCEDGVAQYRCTCDAGYNGANCELDIDECSSNPCIHGVCQDGLAEYSCTCVVGYTGANCELDVDECLTDNGNCDQICTNERGSYTCSCDEGYTLNVDGHKCDAIVCTFGSDTWCELPCNCEDPAEVCDAGSGDCPVSGCKKGLPAGYGWGGPGCQIGNVAYGKYASQTGVYQGNTEYSEEEVASRVVDGDTSTKTHTEVGITIPAWWQVDLGGLHVILNITLYNRNENAYRLNDLTILAGPTETDMIAIAHLTDAVPAKGHRTYPCPELLVARYIKVLKDPGLSKDYNILCFSELVAMGYRYKGETRK
jgi:hypothetical protein